MGDSRGYGSQDSSVLPRNSGEWGLVVVGGWWESGAPDETTEQQPQGPWESRLSVLFIPSSRQLQ